MLKKIKRRRIRDYTRVLKPLKCEAIKHQLVLQTTQVIVDFELVAAKPP